MDQIDIYKVLPGLGWVVVGMLLKLLWDIITGQRKELTKDVKLLTVAVTRLDVQVETLNKKLEKNDGIKDDLNDSYKRLRVLEEAHLQILEKIDKEV